MALCVPVPHMQHRLMDRLALELLGLRLGHDFYFRIQYNSIQLAMI